MNSQQLTNPAPPIIDFLAALEKAQGPNHAGTDACVRNPTINDLIRQVMACKRLRLRLKQMRSWSRAPWWDFAPRQSYWGSVRIIPEVYKPLSPFTGFTGIATINSVRIEGQGNTPTEPENDGFTRYEARAAKDNSFIGDNEVSA